MNYNLDPKINQSKAFHKSKLKGSFRIIPFNKTNINRVFLFHISIYINLACLSVRVFVYLFVFLYPINVKTAEPIGPKFFVGHHVTTGKVYE